MESCPTAMSRARLNVHPRPGASLPRRAAVSARSCGAGLLFAALLACAEPEPEPAPVGAGVAPAGTLPVADAADDAQSGRGDPDASVQPAGGVEPPPLSEELTACAERARAAQTPFPGSIVETVALLNALPQPTSLPCFLATLPRPLSLAATFNVSSAQPAVGRQNPRLFVLSDALIVSIVPAGDGSRLLEFGEFVEAGRSLKAEMEFPIEQPLQPSDPFTRVKYNDEHTTCGFCHREELPHGSIADAFVSLAFQLQPSTEVPIAEVRAEYERCDPAEDAYRCEMLQALFAFGDVVQGSFPEDLALFF